MALRSYDSYPAQEPFSELGARNHARVQELSVGIDGLTFAYGDDPYQEVAVFPVSNPNGAVVAFMHGGGWTNGYKEWMAFMAPALNGQGITFVSMGYRLAPAVAWPTLAEDAAAAVAWVHANISAYGGDPDRIYVGGHSAGGHLATWLSVRVDWQARHGVPLNVIRGAVPVSGVYDFTEGNGMPMRPRFLGDDAANDRDASPLHMIARTPPFLISWGDTDFPHLIVQAKNMAQTIEKSGGSCEVLEFAGCDHLEASHACGNPDGPWISRLSDWIVQHG
jgi:arylformamidase